MLVLLNHAFFGEVIMAKQTALELKRKEVRDEILAMKEKIPTAIMFNFFGRAFKSQSLGYWLSNFIALNLIAFAPWIFIGLLLNELVSNRYLWYPGSVVIVYFVLSLFLVHILTTNIFKEISNQIITKVNEPEDLDDFLQWFKGSWSAPIVLRFIVAVAATWVLLGLGGISLAYQRFVGVGFSITTIITGVIAGISLYAAFWIGWLGLKLKEYHYELNTFSPLKSEVIYDISNILTKRVYLLAAYVAVGNVIGSTALTERSLTLVFSLPIALFVWVIIITLFLIIRSTLVTIVNRAKWKTLNKLELQINSIEAKGDLSDQATAEKILRLADIHERIMATETRIFDLRSLSTLFSQLMLPLLGLLLGNIDQVMALFKK